MRRGGTPIHPARPRGDLPPEQRNAVIQVPGVADVCREPAEPARPSGDARAGIATGGRIRRTPLIASRICDRRCYIRCMCGRVIQSSGPLRYAIVDGMNVRDSRVHNYPPRWNAAPSQELLVIRRNHKTGEVSLDPLRWGLIPYWCNDPKGGRKPINAKCETRARPADVPRGLPQAPLHRAGRRLLRVEGDQGAEGEAALRDRHEGRRAVRARRHLGELEGAGVGRMDSDLRDHHHRRQRAGRRHPRPHAGHSGAGAITPAGSARSPIRAT